MDLSERIVAARVAAGHTNSAAFARLIGESPQKLWRWERQGVEPRPEALARIARETSVDLAWLITGEGYGPPDPRDVVAAIEAGEVRT